MTTTPEPKPAMKQELFIYDTNPDGTYDVIRPDGGTPIFYAECETEETAAYVTDRLNACAGIPTEELGKIKAFDDMAEVLNELLQVLPIWQNGPQGKRFIGQKGDTQIEDDFERAINKAEAILRKAGVKSFEDQLAKDK